MWANEKANVTGLYRIRLAPHLIACMTLMFVSLMIESAIAAPEDEV